MGEVYRASDTRLARKVAIKAIRAGRLSPGSSARFSRRHARPPRSIIPTSSPFTISAAADGRPYIVMEWIEGQTLRQKLAQGPLGIPERSRDCIHRSPMPWWRRTTGEFFTVT